MVIIALPVFSFFASKIFIFDGMEANNAIRMFNFFTYI